MVPGCPSPDGRGSRQLADRRPPSAAHAARLAGDPHRALWPTVRGHARQRREQSSSLRGRRDAFASAAHRWQFEVGARAQFDLARSDRPAKDDPQRDDGVSDSRGLFPLRVELVGDLLDVLVLDVRQPHRHRSRAARGDAATRRRIGSRRACTDHRFAFAPFPSRMPSIISVAASRTLRERPPANWPWFSFVRASALHALAAACDSNVRLIFPARPLPTDASHAGRQLHAPPDSEAQVDRWRGRIPVSWRRGLTASERRSARSRSPALEPGSAASGRP